LLSTDAKRQRIRRLSQSAGRLAQRTWFQEILEFYTVKVLHFLGIGRLPKRPMVDATGGTERTALEVARIQTRRGYQVTVASKADENWEGSWEGVRLLHLAPFSWAKILSLGKIQGSHLPLITLIQLGRFDLVHLHEYLNTKLFFATPKVMHFHNNPLADRDAAKFAEDAPDYWAHVGQSSAQIAVSEFVVKRLRLAHEKAGSNALSANIFRVPGGVESKALPPQKRREERGRIRQKLGLKDEDVLFLFAGALRPEKGVDYLARAFARLSENHSNAYLAIAGGGSLWVERGWLGANPLEATERQVLDILSPAIERGRAFMLGVVPPVEIDRYYAASDVFVLPSMFQETFGLVLLEAFSAGLPVIAFRSGGIPELVDDGKNGIIVAQGDEGALYHNMQKMTEDQELRNRLGSAAKSVTESFPWENTVDRLESVYLDVLKR
jgi:glycosyltransferase involved in cell wall biosynthesis